MAKTNGQVDLTVDVKVLPGKIETDKKMLEALVSKLKTEVEKLHGLEVSPDIKIKLDKLGKDTNKEIAKAAKTLAADLEKGLKQTNLSLGVAEAIKKDLSSAKTALDKDKGVLLDSIKGLSRDSLKAMGDSGRLTKDKTFLGLLADLEGKSAREALATLNKFIKETSALQNSFVQQQASMADLVAKSSKSVKDSLDIAAAGVSPKIAQIKKDIESLEAAKRAINKNETGPIKSVGVDHNESIASYKLLFDTLTKGRAALQDMAAEVRIGNKEALSYGRTSGELALQILALDKDLAHVTATLERLRKEQSDAAKAVDNLANAQARFKDATLALEAVQDRGGKVYLDLLKQQYSAALALGKITGNQGDAEKIAASNKAHQDLLNTLAKDLALQERIAAARDKVAAATRVSLAEEIKARESLQSLYRQGSAEQLKANEQRVNSNAKHIQQLQEIRSDQAAELKAITNLKQAQEALKNHTEQVSRISDNSYKVKLANMDREIALLNKIAGFSGRDADRTAVDNLAKQRETFVKTEAAVESLNAKIATYRTALDSLKTQKLDYSQWDSARKSVEALLPALEKVKLMRGVDSGTLAWIQTWIDSINKEREATQALIEIKKQEAKLDQSVQRQNSAATGNARLKALQGQGNALQNLLHELHKFPAIYAKEIEFTKRSIEHNQQQIKELNTLSKAAGGTANSYNSLTNAFRSFVRYGLEMAAFYKAQQAVSSLAKSVVDLEDAMKSVQAISRSTDTEMERVGAAIKQVSIETEFSVNQIAGAAQGLAQAGVGIDKIGEALSSVAKFASATGSSLDNATDLFTTIQNVYKDLSFDKIADQLTNTINLSKLTGQELSTIMSRALETADSFHILPQQMEAAFAVLRNSGIKASTISTGFREAMLEVFAPDAKTLKFLQRRYHELGTDMSQEAIAAMFQGFAKTADPVRAATQELEKLGYATSANAEFARVYSVRANNVLGVLVKQRDEYVKLTTQIDTQGSAAKGAETQLKALGKSWDNLGGILTVVATEGFGGMLGPLKQVVDYLAQVTTKGGEAINTLKGLTGASGASGSTVAGILAGVGSSLKGGSLIKSTGLGLGVAALSEYAQTKAAETGSAIGQELAEFLARAASAVITVFSIKSILPIFVSKIAPAQTAMIAGMSAAGLNAKASMDAAAAASIGFIDKIKLAFVGLLNLARAHPVGAVIGAAATLLIGSWALFGDNLAGQISSINNSLEKTRKEIKDNQAIEANSKETAGKMAGLNKGLDSVAQGMRDMFYESGVILKEGDSQISKIVSDIQGTSFDLEGSQLTGKLQELGDTIGRKLGDTFKLDKLIDQVNNVSAVIDRVEGTRLDMQQQLLEAYESTSRSPVQIALISAFEKLSVAERAYVTNTVDSFEESRQTYLSLAKFAAAIPAEAALKVKEAQALVAKQESELVDKVVEQSLEASGDFSGVYAKMLQAAKDGNIELLQSYREAIDKAVKDQDLGFIDRLVNGVTGAWGGLIDRLSNKTLESLGKSAGTFAKNLILGKSLSGYLDSKDQNKQDKIVTSGKDASEAGTALQQSVRDNQASDVNKKSKDIQRSSSQSADELASLLTKDQAKRIGLSVSTVEDSMSKLKDSVKPLSSEWEKVYFTAERTGKTATESKEYLLRQTKTLGEFPPKIQELYNGYSRQEEIARSNVVALSKSQGEYQAAANKYEEYSQQVGDLAKKAADSNTSAEGKAKIDKLLLELKKNEEPLLKEAKKKEEEYSKLLSERGLKLVEHVNTQEQLDKFLKDQHKQYLDTAQQLKTRETERANLATDSVSNARRMGVLDKEIYDLKVKEPKARKGALLEMLAKNGEVIAAMRDTGTTIDKLEEFITAPGGPDFSDVISNMIDQVVVTTEEISQAGINLVAGMKEAGTAQIQANYDRNNQIAQQDSSNARHQLDMQDVSSGLRASEETRLLEEELRKQAALRKTFGEEAVALALKVSNQEIALGKSVDESRRGVLIAQKTADQEALNLHSQALTQMQAEETKHHQAVKALRDELRAAQQSDVDFIRGLRRSELTDEFKFDFDRVAAAEDRSKALRLLDEGDYEQGRTLLEKSIQEQQAYVSELKAADEDIRGAESQLKVMTDERNKAITDQIGLRKDAEQAAKAAAEAELAAINSLRGAIDSLTAAISAVPVVDVKVDADKAKTDTSEVKGNLEGLKDKSTKLDVNAQPAMDGIDSVQGALDGLQDKTITITTVHEEVSKFQNSDNIIGGTSVPGRVITKSADGSSFTDAPDPEQYLAGGLVKGPGTGTSDSIPAMLSNKEFVIPADAVEQVGVPFLERVRRGEKPVGFAEGGPVDVDKIRRDGRASSQASARSAMLSDAAKVVESAVIGVALNGADYNIVRSQLSQELDGVPGADTGLSILLGALSKPFIGMARVKEQIRVWMENITIQDQIAQANRESFTNTGPKFGNVLGGINGKALGESLRGVNAPTGNLLNVKDFSNMAKQSQPETKNHTIEIKSSSGQSATVAATEANVGNLLTTLKSIKGVSV